MNQRYRGFVPKYYYKVETRVKNGLLVQLMELHNVSARQLSKMVGISYIKLWKLINLQCSPCRAHPEKYGDLFTRSAKKIAAFFHLEPTEIFPEELWKPLEKNTLEFYLPSKKERLVSNDERQIIYDVLGTLDSRERRVVESLFGLRDGHPMTLKETGQCLNVTSSRVGQIMNKAMYKLRHPYRRRYLSQILNNVNERRTDMYRRPAYRIGL